MQDNGTNSTVTSGQPSGEGTLQKLLSELITVYPDRCGTPYWRVSIKGVGPDGRPLSGTILLLKDRVVGERFEGGAPDSVIELTSVNVDCLSASEFAWEAVRVYGSTRRTTSRGSDQIKPSRHNGVEKSFINSIREYLDSTLGMKLAIDSFWYTRLLLRSRLVHREDRGSLEKVLKIAMEALTSPNVSVLITLTDKHITGRELRVYTTNGRLGIGYIEGAVVDVGLEALRRAIGMTGVLSVYHVHPGLSDIIRQSSS